MSEWKAQIVNMEKRRSKGCLEFEGFLQKTTRTFVIYLPMSRELQPLCPERNLPVAGRAYKLSGLSVRKQQGGCKQQRSTRCQIGTGVHSIPSAGRFYVLAQTNKYGILSMEQLHTPSLESCRRTLNVIGRLRNRELWVSCRRLSAMILR